MRDVVRGLAWISPWLVGFVVFMLVPILLSLYYSLNDYSLTERPVFIGLENYKELARDPLFATSSREHGQLRALLRHRNNTPINRRRRSPGNNRSALQG
jgi:hypothetical protein